MTNSNHSWKDRLETHLNACSLETLHAPTKSGSYPLIIGCYQLNEASSSSSKAETNDDNNGVELNTTVTEGESETKQEASRSGELMLYSINQELKFGTQEDGYKCERIDTGSGVLDGKWLQKKPFHMNNAKENDGNKQEILQSTLSSSEDSVEASYLYATANASGAINVYRLLESEEIVSGSTRLSLDHVGASDADEDEYGLALSLAWDESSSTSCNGSGACTRTRIVSSYSKGSLAIHNVQNGNSGNLQIEETHRWNAHTLFGCPSEVWTVCFASNRHYNTYADTVISGGDDCIMKLWDLRLCNNDSPTKPIATKKNFEAGVTTISYHPSLEHIFAVGSYDEVVRFWDMRKLAEPFGTVHVGGGVWRLKWHPKHEDRILVGAMHGGCRIVEMSGPIREGSSSEDDSFDLSSLSINVVKEFTEHQSMAYGADWIHEENGVYDAAASCSFYDRQAFIWD